MPITFVYLLPIIGNLPITCLQDAYDYLQCVFCRKSIILPKLVLFTGTFLELPVLPSIICVQNQKKNCHVHYGWPLTRSSSSSAHVFFEHFFFIIFLSLGFSLSTQVEEGKCQPPVRMYKGPPCKVGLICKQIYQELIDMGYY